MAKWFRSKRLVFLEKAESVRLGSQSWVVPLGRAKIWSTPSLHCATGTHSESTENLAWCYPDYSVCSTVYIPDDKYWSATEEDDKLWSLDAT